MPSNDTEEANNDVYSNKKGIQIAHYSIFPPRF